MTNRYKVDRSKQNGFKRVTSRFRYLSLGFQLCVTRVNIGGSCFSAYSRLALTSRKLTVGYGRW